MGLEQNDVPTAAAVLTEYATLNSTTAVEPQPLTRKRAITPSGAPRDLEKQSISFDETRETAALRSEKEQGTFLYLAYGSNLAYSTFQGSRGIKPLRALNVHVPELELTFDLPAVPYAEPCMANTRRRTTGKSSEFHGSASLGWTKGLVGVVYEVTAADYKHIIETEGGGMGYKDIQVPCYVLPHGTETIPDPASYPDGQIPIHDIPSSEDSARPFLAHTLLAPEQIGYSHTIRQPEWAQPSARYLGLIRTGSKEHSLPSEYVQWLDSLHYYEKTRLAQNIGGAVFLALWLPLITGLVKGGSIFADKNGLYPKWFAAILQAIFGIEWWSYDIIFRPLAGDGERTEGT